LRGLGNKNYRKFTGRRTGLSSRFLKKGKRKEGLVGKASMAVDIPEHAGSEGSTPGQGPVSGSEREKTSGQSSGTGLFERVFVLPKYTVGRYIA
jgi:hypothetical protein